MCSHFSSPPSFSNKAAISLIAILVFCFPASALPEADFAGTVRVVTGSVSIYRAGVLVPSVMGTRILTKDLIETGPDGRIGLMLHDGTRVALGPKSALSVETFLFQPADGKFGLLIKMLRGAAAYISGEIGRYAPQSVQVETPVGILGLRGTKFAIVLNQPETQP